LLFESAAAILIKKIQLGIYPTKSVLVFVGPVSGSFYLHFAFETKKKPNVFEFYLGGLSGFRIFIRLIVHQHFSPSAAAPF
jgi:hypothetical protein